MKCVICNKNLTEYQIAHKRICCSPKCYKEYNKTIQKPCKECQNNFTPRKNQNKDFCSIECKTAYYSKLKELNKDNRTKEQKARDTYKAKTGYDNPSQNPEVKLKKKNTLLKNYNVTNPMNSELIKQKLYNNLSKKYNKNIRSVLQIPEIREKANKTVLEKYKVDNIAKHKEIMKRGIEKRQENKFSNYNDFNKEYIINNFIKNDLFLIHDFMDYFTIKSTITANKYKKLFNIELPNKIKYCITQQELYSKIQTKNKITNNRDLIKPYELDIILPDYKIAIEYNGLMYHSCGKNQYFDNKDKKYHLTKTELVEQKGYQLLHIFESDNIEIWYSLINNKLGLNKRIFARNTIIKEISNKESSIFLTKNHLQGDCNSKIRLGLYYGENLVSLMTFGKSRYDKNIDYELIRFCSLKGYNVVGGASKLLSHFRKQYSGSIISYANRRWSNGDLYRKLGFKMIGKTDPNYFYFKDGHTELFSRIAFQKHKLKSLLENFNPDLTEEQNMFNNNYRKIYDSGNLVFFLEQSV